MTQQPEALRLADALDGSFPEAYAISAADELRRLHEEVQEQARCNGMGAEREMALRGRITTLEAALRQAVEVLNDTAYRLEQSRIWGGMEWSYHPMHPVKYLPVRDKAREAATTAKQALGEKT